MRRRKGVLLAVGSVVVCCGVLVAYAAGVPPFTKTKKISASEVCGAYGKDRRSVADLLPAVVPGAEEYRVHGTGFPREGVSYEFGCFIASFKARATLIEVGEKKTAGNGRVPERSPQEWLREVVRPNLTQDEMGRSRFRAGELGVAGARMAAIYVPCVPPSHIDPWFHYLNVVVEAGKEPPVSRTESRQAMADLAVLTARHAHERAKCSLPSKLPRKAPDLGEVKS